MTGLVESRDLTVELTGTSGRPILSDVSLDIGSGEVVGLVGESGSGKSTMLRAVMGEFPEGAHVQGSVRVGGVDVVGLPPDALRDHRLRVGAMVFQDAEAALNPVRTVGDFLTEQLLELGTTREAARARVSSLLERVGFADPARVLRSHPHELSGGMLQRVVIAAAVATDPQVLLADEPTSALDASTQAETVALLQELQREKSFGVLFVTHDLPLAAAICDRVYVMYAGRIVEEQPSRALFERPQHPYTRGLLASSPDLHSVEPMRPIPGQPPSLDVRFTGCPFAPRCADAVDECHTWRPQLLEIAGGGNAACCRLPTVAGEQLQVCEQEVSEP